MFLLWPVMLRQPKMQTGLQNRPVRKTSAMKFRYVTLLLASTMLLAGCEAFQQGNYEVQKQFGLYPVDPPRAEPPPPPPPGTISQVDWVAQRSLTMRASNQTDTPPVGYKEPEQAAPVQAAAPAPVTPAAAPRTATAPAARPTAPVATPAPAPAAATANPAAMTPAASSATAASLPAGYTPSPSVVDRPADAAEQQKLAAATGAQPTPPELPAMAGSMKGGAAMTGGWKAHLASHRTESAAINEWQELLKGNPALYGQFDPLVEWTDTQRGPFARLVLVGFADRKAADEACAKVRSSTRYCTSIQ